MVSAVTGANYSPGDIYRHDFKFMSLEKSGNLIEEYVTIGLLVKNFTHIFMQEKTRQP